MLKLQYFEHLMWRADSLEKTLMLGMMEGRRRRGRHRMWWLDGIFDRGHEFEQTPGDSEGQEILECCSPWGCKESDITEWLNNNVCVCVCVRTHACLIMSDTLKPHRLLPTRLLCPGNFPSKNTGSGFHFLLQGIFWIQGLNPSLLHLLYWHTDFLPLHHLGSQYICT